jgi:hypothetical protein
MFRRLILTLAFALVAQPLHAQCGGTNLFDALAPQTQAALRAGAEAEPFAQGLLWQARRGNDRITLAGSFHFGDPRHAATLAALAPYLQSAATLLVEAGPDEEAALKIAMATRLDLLFVPSGPTLPERLPEPDWQRLAAAMQARGVPAFMTAKFKPWYAAMTLSLSPCAMAAIAAGGKGLDALLIAIAQEQGLPIEALEPYDAALRIFDDLPDAGQIDLILSALATADRADDYTATLADAYFAEDTRLIWEFTRHDAETNSGLAAEAVAEQMVLTEDLLLARRNRAWMQVLLPALNRGPALVAVGALHLPGRAGLLNLLQAEGFTLSRLPLHAR